MRIVYFSDTHGHHTNLDIPDGDLLVCGGDFTDKGTIPEALKFMSWFNAQPHLYKILIAGNHDICLDYRRNKPHHLVEKVFSEYIGDGELNHYLVNNGCEIDGIKFWGSPYTPKYGDHWVFEMERGQKLHENWSKIPEDTEVLITHGPPALILDIYNYGANQENIGDADLRYHAERVKPGLHLFGHVHESRGFIIEDNTTYINGSIKVDNSYELNSAFVIDYEPNGIVLYDNVNLIPSTPY